MEPIPHDVATKELAEHLAPIFEESPDGVYVWLDEEHWTCNARFAAIFGYDGPDELNDTPHLLQRIVHEDDQQLFSWHYWNRVQALVLPRHVPLHRRPQGRLDRAGRDGHDPADLRRPHVRLPLRPAGGLTGALDRRYTGPLNVSHAVGFPVR